MTMKIKAKGMTDAKISRVEKTIAQNLSRELEHKIGLFIEEALARTPVFTGKAIANFYFTLDAPASATSEPNTSAPITETNKLPLGVEPRRGPNEDLSRSRFANVKVTNPYRSMFITNTAPYFLALEYGSAPPEGEHESRVPAGGIMRGAAQRLKL